MGAVFDPLICWKIMKLDEAAIRGTIPCGGMIPYGKEPSYEASDAKTRVFSKTRVYH